MIEFYIFGDMGSGSQSQYDVSNALLEDGINQKKDTFVCGLGDNIYENGCYSLHDNQFYTKFEKPYEKISNEIKFFMCLGNHDYGYHNNGDIISHINNSEYQIQYGIQSQHNGGKWYMPSNCYHYSKEDVNFKIEFFVMDSNFDVLTKKQKLNQFRKLKKWIKSSDAHWKILVGHHTWKSVGYHGGENPEFENYLRKLFKETSFDVYMCGHDHIKQVSEYKINNKKVSLIICGTGGGEIIDLETDVDFNKLNINNYELLFLSCNLGYCNCKATKSKLIFTFKNEKNQLEYIYNIKK